MNSWSDRRIGGLGAATLMVLLLVLPLVGCGGSGNSSSTAAAGTPGQSPATSAGSTGTAAASAAGRPAHGTGSKSTSGAAAHATPPLPAALLSGHLLRRFTGSGNARLGTFAVSSPTVLAWRVRHPPLQVFTAHGFILVSSHAAVGVVRLSRGSYAGTRISTHAGWTIELRTRS
jgi:hypothetical protein